LPRDWRMQEEKTLNTFVRNALSDQIRDYLIRSTYEVNATVVQTSTCLSKKKEKGKVKRSGHYIVKYYQRGY